MRNPPSIKDVAALAGVSTQSVTRVAHGSASVSPQMRERVQAAMKQLGYQPNYAARALRTGRTRMIGVTVDHLGYTGSALMFNNLVDRALEHGYGISLVAYDIDERRTLVQSAPYVAGLSVDGVIATSFAAVRGRFDEAFPNKPIVTIGDTRKAGFDWPSVDIDQPGISRMAVEYLLGLGHRTVHHVGGPSNDSGAIQRAEGWRTTLWERACVIPEFEFAGWWAGDGYRAGLKLARDPECTAVYAVNDTVALGVIEAMRECGRRVPEDVSVVGVDDSVEGYFAHNILTSVRQPYAEVSKALVETLIGLIEGREVEERHVELSGELIVRSSAAAPSA